MIFNGKERTVTTEEEEEDLAWIENAFIKGRVEGRVLIKGRVERGVEVEEITRVNNPFLKERYNQAKERLGMGKGRGWARETMMFHGTPKGNIPS